MKFSPKLLSATILMLSLSVIPAIASVHAQSPDFSLTPTTFSTPFNAGFRGSDKVTFTVTSLNGFSGTVSFTITSVPAGYSTKINPVSVILNSGGTNSTTLTVSYDGIHDCASFRMTFTAASRSLQHTSSGATTCRL